MISVECPCCTAPDIDANQSVEPYLCDDCDYITDDYGAYYCGACDIHMERTPAWHHSYVKPYHRIVKP